MQEKNRQNIHNVNFIYSFYIFVNFLLIIEKYGLRLAKIERMDRQKAKL